MMIFIDILDSSSHRTKSTYQTNRILCILGQSWCVLLMWDCQNVSVGAGETCCHFLSSSKLQAFVASATDAFSKLLSSGRPGCCVDSLLTSLNSFLFFLVLYFMLRYRSVQYIFLLVSAWKSVHVSKLYVWIGQFRLTDALRSWQCQSSATTRGVHGRNLLPAQLKRARLETSRDMPRPLRRRCSAGAPPLRCRSRSAKLLLSWSPEASQAGWGSRG